MVSFADSDIIDLYVGEELSTLKVGRRLGISPRTVRRVLKRHQVERHHDPSIPLPARELHLNHFELGYLAAVIDCEGSISVRRARRPGNLERKNSYRLRIRVDNTDPRLITWLYVRFGGNRSKRRYPPGSTRRDSYRWSLDRVADAEQLLRIVEPHLVLKQEQALAALKLEDWEVIISIITRLKHFRGLRELKFLRQELRKALRETAHG